jgi:hypothetical protein
MAIADNTFSPEELANEIWRSVVGYERFYSVSNLGRVRRDAPPRGNCASCKVGRILKPILDSKGYLRVNLYSDSKGKSIFIHKLVTAAFIGVRPTHLVVNHKDACKTNNRIENLEYVTELENTRHATEMGLMARGDRHNSRTKPETVLRGDKHPARLHPEKMARGERNGNTKIKDAEVSRIFELKKQGLSGRKIAPIIGCSFSQVCRILNGKYRSTARRDGNALKVVTDGN